MLQKNFVSPYFATTLTYANIYHVSQEDFQSTLDEFPAASASLAQYAQNQGYAEFASLVSLSSKLARSAQSNAAPYPLEEQELVELKSQLAMIVSEIKTKDEALKIVTREKRG